MKYESFRHSYRSYFQLKQVAFMPLIKPNITPETVTISSFLEDVKPTDWLIESVLDKGTLAALVAQPSRFKSFVALSMACSISTGTPWMGKPTTKGPVVLLAGEGLQGIKSRTRAWFDHHDIDESTSQLMITKGTFAAQDDTQMGCYIRSVEEVLKTHRVTQSPSLIIVDTYSRYAASLDENSASETAGMIAQLGRLQSRFGATVLVVHHVSKATGDARGSSAFVGALDWQYSLVRNGDETTSSSPIDLRDLRVKLKLTKSKDHGGIDPLPLKATIVEGHHKGIAKVPYNSLVFDLDFGDIESVYDGLGSATRDTLQFILMALDANPDVTAKKIASDLCRPNLSQEYRMLCDWLKGRIQLHQDLHVTFPDGQGFAAFKQLLQPFMDNDLPEAKLTKSLQDIDDL